MNHATLAGHTFEHELACAVDAGMLGSIDANRGDAQNGWDTDQFPIDNYDLLKAYLKDEEEDLYWSQGAMELIEKIGTQNWLPKDRIDNKYPTLFSSQGYILRSPL